MNLLAVMPVRFAYYVLASFDTDRTTRAGEASLYEGRRHLPVWGLITLDRGTRPFAPLGPEIKSWAIEWDLCGKDITIPIIPLDGTRYIKLKKDYRRYGRSSGCWWAPRWKRRVAGKGEELGS